MWQEPDLNAVWYANVDKTLLAARNEVATLQNLISGMGAQQMQREHELGQLVANKLHLQNENAILRQRLGIGMGLGFSQQMVPQQRQQMRPQQVASQQLQPGTFPSKQQIQAARVQQQQQQPQIDYRTMMAGLQSMGPKHYQPKVEEQRLAQPPVGTHSVNRQTPSNPQGCSVGGKAPRRLPAAARKGTVAPETTPENAGKNEDAEGEEE